MLTDPISNSIDVNRKITNEELDLLMDLDDIAVGPETEESPGRWDDIMARLPEDVRAEVRRLCKPDPAPVP